MYGIDAVRSISFLAINTFVPTDAHLHAQLFSRSMSWTVIESIHLELSDNTGYLLSYGLVNRMTQCCFGVNASNPVSQLAFASHAPGRGDP